MSHSLPLLGSPQREMFEIQDLIDICSGKREIVDLQQAKQQARRIFAGAKRGLVKRVIFIIMRADDELQLVSIGSRGGLRVEWRFGPYQSIKEEKA